jgi:hypothetical protein
MGTAVIVEAGSMSRESRLWPALCSIEPAGRVVSAGEAAEPIADVNTFGGVGRKT